MHVEDSKSGQTAAGHKTLRFSHHDTRKSWVSVMTPVLILQILSRRFKQCRPRCFYNRSHAYLSFDAFTLFTPSR